MDLYPFYCVFALVFFVSETHELWWSVKIIGVASGCRGYIEYETQLQ